MIVPTILDIEPANDERKISTIGGRVDRECDAPSPAELRRRTADDAAKVACKRDVVKIGVIRIVIREPEGRLGDAGNPWLDAHGLEMMVAVGETEMVRLQDRLSVEGDGSTDKPSVGDGSLQILGRGGRLQHAAAEEGRQD